MSDKRYTMAQIYCGLRQFFTEHLGCETPFEPRTPWVEYLKSEGLWDDFWEEDAALGYFFGYSGRDWVEYATGGVEDRSQWEATVAPFLTFRSLAEFIREHAAAVSLEPVTLLGKPCATAGAFRGVEGLARQIDPKIPRFGPSTPIQTRLRGPRLYRYWDRLRWVTEDRVPTAATSAFLERLHDFTLRTLLGKLGLAVLASLVLGDWDTILVSTGAVFLLLILAGWSFWLWKMYRVNPLPEGVHTFGDLARFVVQNSGPTQHRWASCSSD
jgi:hypothetical protein